jgi:hypothetical protein
LISPEIEAMARGWYGYGRWEAPYWFIGIEPGGDELDECLRRWNSLGRSELLDIATHHEKHDRDFFGKYAVTQETWRALIWLLLAFKGIEPTRDNTLDYQKYHFGRSGDETAVIEISCLPAPHSHVPSPRHLFRTERADLIRNRIVEHRPRFVVLYSPDVVYREAWHRIAGQELDRDEIVSDAFSNYIMTYHPRGKWQKEYWANIGRRLRELLVEDRGTRELS